MKNISSALRNLTLDDLQEWAGAKIFNRGKSYVRNVSGLSRMQDVTLTAWVAGSQEYATSIRPAISNISEPALMTGVRASMRWRFFWPRQSM
jgi:uncharacterized Zn finger protein